MWTRLWKEVAARGHAAPAPALVTEDDLDGLPPTARRYLAAFGVVPGTPRHGSFALGWRGRFRMGRDRPWMPVEAVQYNTREPVARFFHMKARMGGVLPVLARDTYADCRGRMLARLAGLLTVADGEGPEYDESELVTWLDDAVLFAPSMLLGARTRWGAVDDRHFDLDFTDGGQIVSARVTIDERGRPIDFETGDRFVADPDDRHHPLIRARWSTPIDRWTTRDGLPFPAHALATWHLRSGDLTYADFSAEPGSLAFDVAPTSSADSSSARSSSPGAGAPYTRPRSHSHP